MTTKERVLQLLEANRGTYFSGEELAQRLSVSRAAVWKAVTALREQGYSIHAANNRGYCLSAHTDILSPQGIQKYLRPEYQDLELHVLPSVDSTNTLVRQKAGSGAPEGYVVIANEQTAGQGRCGKSFFSPAGTGLYLSILLRPSDCSAQQASGFTMMAAAAMCKAMEEVAHQQPRIKWVNDIFIRGKKVCGILTEGSFGLENGLMDSVVLGVGVNVQSPQEGFPAELEGIATSLFQFPGEDAKNRLAASFLNHFLEYYTAREQGDYREDYRRYSLVIGQRITLQLPQGSRSAAVTGIDDLCRLMVRYDSGETDRLPSGRIQLKLETSSEDV